MGGPERGGFIYPRVDEGGTARSLYSRKDVALGSVKPQIPGFSVEGGGCGGPKKGEGAHPSTLGQTKGAPPVLCSPRRICKSSAFRYRSMKLCTDDLYGKYFKIFLRDNFYIIYIYIPTYIFIYR